MKWTDGSERPWRMPPGLKLKGTTRGVLWLLWFIMVAITIPLSAAGSADATIPENRADEASELYVDLTERPAFVRRDFSPRFIRETDPRGEEWISLPERSIHGRPIRIKDLDVPGVPRRRPFSLRRFPPMEFTIVIPFHLSRDAVAAIHSCAAESVPGIHLASIADNWAIYLNGSLVREEIHLLPDGSIEHHRGYRDVHIPLDPSNLVPGVNVLGFHVIGDPTHEETGLRQAGPYYIGRFDRIQRANMQYVDIVLLGLYLFVGIYHLFIYSVQPGSRQYLYYALFSITVSIYAFMRTNVVQWIIPDHYINVRIELISLYTLIPLLSAFIDTLEGGPIRRPTRWYGYFCLVLIGTVVVAPLPFSFDVLTVWQISALGMGIYLFVVRLVYEFVAHAVRRYRRNRRLGVTTTRFRVFVREVVETPKGNLLIGGTLLFGSGMYDLVDAAVLHLDIVLTKYGFFLFTMGTALVLANRYIFLNRRVSDLNSSLEERIHQVTEASRDLAVNEAKYRSLFEGVSEPVALLDRELRFSEANPAAQRAFDLGGANGPATLFDCLYREHTKDTFQVEELKNAVNTIHESNDPKDVQLRVRSPLGEPEARRVRLQNIAGTELLLRVLSDDYDPMIDCLQRGAERYVIPSLLSSAREVCRRVTTPLARYVDRGTVEFLGMCLNEIVINAVEHGNLEVSFDEKTEAMQGERYFEFLLERQKDDRFRDRTVTVEWSVTSERAVFRVTDEGPGFDHVALLRRVHDPTSQTLQHGRGLMMAMNAFDRVVYNDRGNQVTVVKRFH